MSDTNECERRDHTCDHNAVCQNTEGSYTCACKEGFSGDGRQCEGKFFFLKLTMV